MDCALRTGLGLPTAFPRASLGAPCLRPCPQASHTLGLRLENPKGFPHQSAQRSSSATGACKKAPRKAPPGINRHHRL